MATAFKNADILLPKEGTDMSKWAVIACDQYTSEPEYWDKTKEIVGDAPSTLNLILPEVYLEEDDVEARLEKIHAAMKDYKTEGIFTEYKDSMIYLERTDSTGKVRAGLIGKLDLEEYNYQKGSKSQVRATEATVIERIPPRIKVRKGADVELPHIMILIDDDKKTVLEPLEKKTDTMKKVYDFTLMQNGGSVKGYLLGEEEKKAVDDALTALCDLDSFNAKYNLQEENVLLYAMGDGNHSLATAKEFYEQLKAANPGKDLSNHPARYALVEIVNLHSPALEFEAIHRILTEIDADDLMAKMTETLGIAKEGEGQKLQVVKDGKAEEIIITKPCSKLTVGSLQSFLDTYLKETGGKIDYIHGSDTLKNLTKQPQSIGFILPDMGKEELFPTVICDGALPRKTFSMGHAEDKRYYIECRKITD
ncbi:MAG: DUF1015 domain-containing protein [Lachnospiraceae bacterium]|nr:DUF1015 domain-containing protein [Lachnospiraceae bacterium]